MKQLLEKYPEDRRLKADAEWYDSVYDDLEERFQDDAFYFLLGFVLYTAQR